MRIKNPETSEIAYIQEEFNLTDSNGNILKKISFSELKNWIEYENSIKLSDKEKQFIASCVENLGCTLIDKITQIEEKVNNIQTVDSIVPNNNSEINNKVNSLIEIVNNV